MSSLSGYRDIQVLTPYPSESGGRILNDNFRILADDIAAISISGASTHTALTDMPDISGSNSDHDIRYVVKVQPTTPTLPTPYSGMIWLDNSSEATGTYPSVLSSYSLRSIMFNPQDAEMPTSNYASYDMIFGAQAIKFAASGNEWAGFSSIGPSDFTNALNGKLTLSFYLATTGVFGEDATWQVYFNTYGDHTTTSGLTTSFTTPYSGTYGYLQHGIGYITAANSGLYSINAERPFKMNLNCNAIHDIYLLSAVLKLY